MSETKVLNRNDPETALLLKEAKIAGATAAKENRNMDTNPYDRLGEYILWYAWIDAWELFKWVKEAPVGTAQYRGG